MRSRWLGFVIGLVVLVVAIWAYPQLPPRVPSHWNFRGEVDGYSARWVAAFVLPAAIFVMTGLMHLFPKIDPRGPNYAKFPDTYWFLMNGILLFMGFMSLAVLANGLGAPVPIGRVAPIGVGFLFVVIGNYLGRVQPNWFLGIRTPWTLSSDTVWRKTHRVGGRLFVLGGLLLMAAAFLPGVRAVIVFIVTMVVVAVVPLVYSFILWKRERAS